MLVRGNDGRIHIINRKDYKNESEYNKKIYNIRLAYISKYKSIIINTPKYSSSKKETVLQKNFSDD
jgi:Ni,Fe-hydrogenase maturation factor